MRFPSPPSRHSRLRLAAGLLATTMLCSTGNAFAQDEPQEPATTEPATTADTQSRSSEDDTNIIVTATRRAENLQDVPLAITALGTQTLEQLQVDDFSDYAQLVPSLSSNQLAPGFNRTFIIRRKPKHGAGGPNYQLFGRTEGRDHGIRDL